MVDSMQRFRRSDSSFHHFLNSGHGMFGAQLSGKVRVVSRDEDLKVRLVSSGEDLRIRLVDWNPSDCGQWQVVSHDEDFKIRFVDTGEDLKIREVETGEGIPL